MGVVLFVRSCGDILRTVENAGEFFAHQRRAKDNVPGQDVLGIWVDCELESSLPAWAVSSSPSPSEKLNGTPFSVAHSLSLSGIWTLCWVDVAVAERKLQPEARCEALLRALYRVFSVRRSHGAGPFFPVFTNTDSIERIEATVRDLKARYPELVGPTWFVQDKTHGRIKIGGGWPELRDGQG